MMNMSDDGPSIIQIVDSVRYVTENCFQHQLLAYLKRCFKRRHVVVELKDVGKLSRLPKPNDVTLLSTIKIRNVYSNVLRLAQTVGDQKIYVYDQDPWESFIDGATYPHGYETIKKHLAGAEFIVTSSWWQDFVSKKGFPVHFCRMWMLPDYCDNGKLAKQRVPGLVFGGTLHGV